MEIKDNFNIFNLFLDKKIKIYVDAKFFQLKLPTIKEFSLNDTINSAYHMWNLSPDKMKAIVPTTGDAPLDFVKTILFQLGIYKEYKEIVNRFKEALSFFIPNIEIDYKNKELIVNDIIITNEI